MGANRALQSLADRLRGLERRYVDKGRVSCPYQVEFGADVEQCLACPRIVEAHLDQDRPYVTCAPGVGTTTTRGMSAGWEHY